MSFEDIDAEITLLLKDLEEDYGDQHEALERIRQMIEKTKAYGMEPPQELVTLVGVLEQESRGEGPAGTRNFGLSRAAAHAREDYDHQRSAEAAFRRRS